MNKKELREQIKEYTGTLKDIKGDEYAIVFDDEFYWIIDLIRNAERENWEAIAEHIKHLICMYDHVNDDPNKVISDINNVLDDAFGHMPTAIEKINSKGIK